MLPSQILLNNFLYDVSQVSIPSDNVDPAMVRYVSALATLQAGRACRPAEGSEKATPELPSSSKYVQDGPTTGWNTGWEC